MAEGRTERDHILARRPRPMQVKLQRACAPERLAATYSSPCNRDGRARGCPKALVPVRGSREGWARGQYYESKTLAGR